MIINVDAASERSAYIVTPTPTATQTGTPTINTSGLYTFLDAALSASYTSGTSWDDASSAGNDFTWNSTPSYTSTSPYYLDTDYPNYVAGDSNLQLTNASGVTFQIWVNLDSYTAGGGTSASYNSFIDAFYGSGTGDQILLKHSAADNALYFNVKSKSAATYTLPSTGS